MSKRPHDLVSRRTVSTGNMPEHEASPGMRYRMSEIPAVGRFGRTSGDHHSAARTILTVNLRQMPLEEVQALERRIANHPHVQTRRFMHETLPLTSALKMLATIRQELADRGHPVTDFPEQARRPGPLSQTQNAQEIRRYRAALKANPKSNCVPVPPWLLTPETNEETK